MPNMTNRTLYSFCLTAVMASIFVTNPSKSFANELSLSEILSAHKNSRENVVTLSCKTFLETNAITPKGTSINEKASAKFWSSRDALRAIVTDQNGTYDYTWDNSVRTGLTQSSGKFGQTYFGANRKAFPARHMNRSDPWYLGLMVVAAPESIEGLPLEILIGKADGLPELKKSIVNGNIIYIIGLKFLKS